MFCLRSFITELSVPSYFLKLAATRTFSRGDSQFYRAKHMHIRASNNKTPIFGGRGRQPFTSQSSQLPELLPLDVPVDEEIVPGYMPQYFYPANPGDVLNGRYELKAKIGLGSSSTVWLARDTRR